MRHFKILFGALSLLALALAVILAAPSVFSQDTQGRIRGSVTSADGKPMEGVTVSVRGLGEPFVTTVFTNEHGVYVFPLLGSATKYSLWAQAQGFETAKTDAIPGKQVAALQLKPLKDFSKQLTGVEWMNSFPENTPQEKREKQIFVSNCSGCHDNHFALQNRFDADGWNKIITVMSKDSEGVTMNSKAVGETLSTKLSLTPQVALLIEHGVGAKLDVIPFDALNPRPDYLPYPGPAPQGSTFLHHAHVGAELGRHLLVTGHYLTAWTPDDHNAPGTTSVPGRLSVVGGDAHVSAGAAGDGYVGFSHIAARHVLAVADAIEVLHSSGGYQLKNNFFGRYDPRTKLTPPDDSGRIESVLLQYALSLGKLARYPARFTGIGSDLTLTVFGMYNVVRSNTFDHEMLKYGVDALYSMFEVLAVGARFDTVNPDMASRRQSFSVLSPRIVLRTRFIARERVVLEYSRYFLGKEAYAAFPYNALPQADNNALMLSASMAF